MSVKRRKVKKKKKLEKDRSVYAWLGPYTFMLIPPSIVGRVAIWSIRIFTEKHGEDVRKTAES